MLEQIIATVLEQSILAGAFIYMLYYLTNKHDATLLEITSTQKEMTMTLGTVCITMGDISDTLGSMSTRLENVEREVQKMKEV